MKYDPNLHEILNREAELEEKRNRRNASASEPTSVDQSVQIPTNTSVVNAGDFWRIEGVPYRSGIYTVDLLKELLDAGNARTQDEWVAYSKESMKNKGFYVPDFQLFHSVLSTLYTNRNNAGKKNEIEEIRADVKVKARAKWRTTST